MEIWGVSDVTRYVKQVIEDDLRLRDVWVEGEVSNFTISMSGHAFFTLRDSASQLKCVMFRPYVQRMRNRLANGEQGVARGAIRVYEAQGVYQLYAEFLAPAGLGEAQIRLQELLARLEAEGLFEPSRKRPLPAWPRRVGVVTSATGAVIHDIRTVVARRYPLATIVLAPAPVQGADAAPRIGQALARLNEVGNVDVIIVARGGGSSEDLSAFNDEVVARAIFASRAPVVSAIGHETDTTIADLVADRRAPTPSAAAEMVVPNVQEIRARLDDLGQTIHDRTRFGLDQVARQIARLELSLTRRAPVDEISRRRARLSELRQRATRAVRHLGDLQFERVRAREAQLVTLSPLAVLRRGYSVCTHGESGAPVTSVSQVDAGVRVRTRVLDGTFDSQVASKNGRAAAKATLRDK